MKKGLFLVMLAMICSITAFAKDIVTRDANQLPAAARTLIRKHYPTTKITYIKIEKEPFEQTKYEAVMENGVEIEFNKKGDWSKIDCKLTPVPQALIPVKIKAYLKEHFPEYTVEKIEKDRKGYEVDLKDSFSVKFDTAGNFITLDD